MFGNSRGKYPVPREWQDVFIEFLDECGLDGYGNINDTKLEKYLKTRESEYTYKDVYGEDCKNENIRKDFEEHPDIEYFDNGIFIVNPYYWGDAEDLAVLPNFVYYPTGYEVQWYKYPLRDSYCNQDITFEEFKDILEKCRKSMEEEL